MDPERFELCVAPCKGLDFSIEKSTLTDAFVWTQRDSNCVQPPVKGSTFSINKKSTLADAFVWTQRDSNCAQPPVKGSTSQSIKKHPCGCFCVDPERFELSTFSMPLRRAPNCAMGPCLLVQLFPMALPIPRKGTSCAMGLYLLVQLFPMALPTPREGTSCAMGPCFSFL